MFILPPYSALVSTSTFQLRFILPQLSVQGKSAVGYEYSAEE